jgi:hypothetical protein
LLILITEALLITTNCSPTNSDHRSQTYGNKHTRSKQGYN